MGGGDDEVTYVQNAQVDIDGGEGNDTLSIIGMYGENVNSLNIGLHTLSETNEHINIIGMYRVYSIKL